MIVYVLKDRVHRKRIVLTKVELNLLKVCFFDVGKYQVSTCHRGKVGRFRPERNFMISGNSTALNHLYKALPLSVLVKDHRYII